MREVEVGVEFGLLGDVEVRLDGRPVQLGHARQHAQARAADGEDRALVLLEQALWLWRGQPCAGLDTPWVNTLQDALEQDRFAVELDCTDLQLRRGQHGWLLNELSTRAKGHPLDERVASQVMLALYRSGRQAEALEHFQRRCQVVGGVVGCAPGRSSGRDPFDGRGVVV